ncbi:MAG: amidohydrolase family protein [Planctomycetaceae bacterium]|nr:amidohydrolase family protein [Planctomycetaceae bacterium]
MMPHSTTLQARWVFPVARPPIENGLVEIADGRIVSVRSADRFAALPDEIDSLALIPGLVNTHTHLEFSDLRTPLPVHSTFAEWIRLIVGHRRTRGEYPTAAVQDGLRESAASGVTTLGEIATLGWSADCFGSGTPRTIAFREAISLSGQNTELTATINEHLASLREHPSVIGGVSPHAPYSVHPEFFRRLVSLAAEARAPLAVHLAESRDELQLLDSGTGALVDLFSESGFWKPDAIPHGTRPLHYLQMIAELPRAMVIHGNYLSDEECAFLRNRPNLSVVYCPRTHAHFGHEPHPWLKLRAQGIRVALGTDSRASNPDLSLWNELLFLRSKFPQVPPQDLLEMGTRAGAAALGLDHVTGTLTPGLSADVTAIRLADMSRSDPHEALLQPQSRPVATLRGGTWIAGSPDSLADV